MGLDTLLEQLERRAVTLPAAGVTAAETVDAAPAQACTVVALVTGPILERVGEGSAEGPPYVVETMEVLTVDEAASLESWLIELSVQHAVTRLSAEADERRRCTDCQNLASSGVCLAARRGEIVATANFEPVQDLLQRCEGYLPNEEDWDQRPGWMRWPGLVRTEKLRQKQRATGRMVAVPEAAHAAAATRMDVNTSAPCTSSSGA